MGWEAEVLVQAGLRAMRSKCLELNKGCRQGLLCCFLGNPG